MNLKRIQQPHSAAGEFVHHIAVGLQNLSQPLLQRLGLWVLPALVNPPRGAAHRW